ncbi:MAG: cystine ABC transporter substrate-binding protein, partial [Pseudomonas sp.]|nr:cystine ABC transporter substrate-binding protein [Pseudomonas sp.]
MRLLPGLMLLLPLASPFAPAELIDDINDRG